MIGEGSDRTVGGVDPLLSQAGRVEGGYPFTPPTGGAHTAGGFRSICLNATRGGDKIDFLRSMDDVFSVESSSSCDNAFLTAVPYPDPSAKLRMAEPLDPAQARGGEPQYLVRELFAMQYPGLPIPDEVPMPYLADWQGPVRPEFKQGRDMAGFTGNQKWQLWWLEGF